MADIHKKSDWLKAEVAKLVAKHPAATVDERTGCAYVTTGRTVHYLDDSTGERIRDTWERDNWTDEDRQNWEKINK